MTPLIENNRDFFFFDYICLIAEFRKCAQTGWTSAGRVSPAKLLDHCQRCLQPRRLRTICLATIVYSTPSTGRETRKLPCVRFRYAVAPAKRKSFLCRHHFCRYLSHGLHGIFQIPKTKVIRLMMGYFIVVYTSPSQTFLL